MQELTLFGDPEPEIIAGENAANAGATEIGEPMASAEPAEQSPVVELQLNDVLTRVNLVEIENHEIDGQLAFVDDDSWWKEHWNGMPEYINRDDAPWKTLYVHIRCYEDMQELAAVLGQSIKISTPSVWYPPRERANRTLRAYVDESTLSRGS